MQSGGTFRMCSGSQLWWKRVRAETGEMHGGEDGGFLHGFLTFLTYFFDFFDLPAARYTRFRMPIADSPPSRAFALPVSPSVISRSIPTTTGSQSGVRRPVSK